MANATFGWDDVGSWVALQNHFPEDDHKNIVVGHSEMIDSHNNIVISDEKLVAMVGVSDLVIVQHQGSTLICQKKYAQDVKKIVAKLKECRHYSHLI
jgi:mannose-1-phosphate guanylyltransferase